MFGCFLSSPEKSLSGSEGCSVGGYSSIPLFCPLKLKSVTSGSGGGEEQCHYGMSKQTKWYTYFSLASCAVRRKVTSRGVQMRILATDHSVFHRIITRWSSLVILNIFHYFKVHKPTMDMDYIMWSKIRKLLLQDCKNYINFEIMCQLCLLVSQPQWKSIES